MVELEGLEPTEAANKDSKYTIAKKDGTDNHYGYTSSENEDGGYSWSQGDITRYDSNNGLSIGDSNGDSKYNDNPDGGLLSDLTNFLRTDSELYASFYNSLRIGTKLVDSQVGIDLANHFKNGAGATKYWYSNSVLATEIGSSQGFSDYANVFEQAALDYFNINSSLDGFKSMAISTLSSEPNLNYSSLFLTATVGGIQRVKATITKISANDIMVTYFVLDRFGAGSEDQSGSKQFFPGLVDMSVLQYYRANETTYRPFKNFIFIKR